VNTLDTIAGELGLSGRPDQWLFWMTYEVRDGVGAESRRFGPQADWSSKLRQMLGAAK
jgi:hypothetical protein